MKVKLTVTHCSNSSTQSANIACEGGGGAGCGGGGGGSGGGSSGGGGGGSGGGSGPVISQTTSQRNHCSGNSECSNTSSQSANIAHEGEGGGGIGNETDDYCYFDPSLPKCAPDENGNCPDGFGHTDDDQCIPIGDCPSGYVGKRAKRLSRRRTNS